MPFGDGSSLLSSQWGSHSGFLTFWAAGGEPSRGPCGVTVAVGCVLGGDSTSPRIQLDAGHRNKCLSLLPYRPAGPPPRLGCWGYARVDLPNSRPCGVPSETSPRFLTLVFSLVPWHPVLSLVPCGLAWHGGLGGVCLARLGWWCWSLGLGDPHPLSPLPIPGPPGPLLPRRGLSRRPGADLGHTAVAPWLGARSRPGRCCPSICFHRRLPATARNRA